MRLGPKGLRASTTRVEKGQTKITLGRSCFFQFGLFASEWAPESFRVGLTPRGYQSLGRQTQTVATSAYWAFCVCSETKVTYMVYTFLFSQQQLLARTEL